MPQESEKRTEVTVKFRRVLHFDVSGAPVGMESVEDAVRRLTQHTSSMLAWRVTHEIDEVTVNGEQQEVPHA